MFRNRWLMLAGVIVVVGVLVWGWRRGGTVSTIDLLPLLPQADKRAAPIAADVAIKAVTVTMGGEAKPCVLEQPVGRIKFRMKVPADAWFSASLGVDPAAWDKEGDGVLFRMGVVSGDQYEELLNQHVNPVGNASDRRWIPVAIDLAAYAGREVDIQLSTNPSQKGQPTDMRNDLGVWCSPTITVGR